MLLIQPINNHKLNNMYEKYAYKNNTLIFREIAII